MESGIQSSFIPQDAAKPSTSPRDYRTGGLADLLFLIAIVAFVASAALGAAVFLYKEYVQTSATSKVEQLQKAKAAFEPALIHELTRLDDRMQVADRILSSHLAPTAFFDALQLATLTTVSFGSLELQAADAQHMTIKMTGVAQSVNSIALQADLFSKNGVITSPIFSDINRQKDGVHFNLTALVNPAAINFVQLISGLNGTMQSTQQAAPTAPGPTSPFGSPGAGAQPDQNASQNAQPPQTGLLPSASQ
jgi:hypothetical protein